MRQIRQNFRVRHRHKHTRPPSHDDFKNFTKNNIKKKLQ